MRVFLALSLLFFVGCGASQQGAAEAALPDAEARLVILQINDTDTLYPIGREDTSRVARVVMLVNEVRIAEPHVVFLHGGDMISPAVDSNVFRGRQMVEAFNYGGLDMAVLGNHEFDYGLDGLIPLDNRALRPPWYARIEAAGGRVDRPSRRLARACSRYPAASEGGMPCPAPRSWRFS